MRARNIFWIGVLLLLAWMYVHFFTSVGVVRSIRVSPSLRPVLNRQANDTVYPVYFTLDEEYILTSVRATTETNAENPHGRVVWDLVSKDGSAPVKFFQYGQNIAGMSPRTEGMRVEPLQPNQAYDLELKAGKIKGGTRFTTREIPK